MNFLSVTVSPLKLSLNVLNPQHLAVRTSTVQLCEEAIPLVLFLNLCPGVFIRCSLVLLLGKTAN